MRLTAHRLPTHPDELRALLTAGANAVELDVQLYAGQLRVSHAVPVLSHTPYLRVEGHRLSLSRRPPGRPLAQVLAELPPQLLVTYDLKNERGRTARDLAARLSAEVNARPAMYAASTNPKSLSILRRFNWPTMLSIGDHRSLVRLLTSDRERPDALAVRQTLLTRTVLSRLADRGHSRVIAWVVNDVSRALELVRWGVSGITSDRAEVFKTLTTPPA